MIYLQLFWEFFKTGLFAVGGGLATIPFLYDMAARYDWFTTKELANMLAISESTPGPIGVNMATFAGINAAGIPGGIVATLALVLPSFFIMLLIAGAMARFRDNRIVQSVMKVLRPVSVGLICSAALTVLRVAYLQEGESLRAVFQQSGTLFAMVRWPALALGAVILAVSLKWKKLHPVALIAIGAVGGIALGL